MVLGKLVGYGFQYTFVQIVQGDDLIGKVIFKVIDWKKRINLKIYSRLYLYFDIE